jgi:hypothetical protein
MKCLDQRFVTCGPQTPGGLQRLLRGSATVRKLNNFSQQINKVKKRKKATSEIEDFKTLSKSEGI